MEKNKTDLKKLLSRILRVEKDYLNDDTKTDKDIKTIIKKLIDEEVEKW